MNEEVIEEAEIQIKYKGISNARNSSLKTPPP